MFTVSAMEKSGIYGHGMRLVIWFSGCSLRCEGCVNSNLWDKSAGKEYTLAQLFSAIECEKPSICGVTFIGGEPLQQGEELLELCKQIINSGLDIVLFTGYDLHELNSWQKSIADMSAVVISGRYIKALRDTNLLLRGSSNQIITVNDGRVRGHYLQECRQVEVIITEDEDKYLGFPEDFI